MTEADGGSLSEAKLHAAFTDIAVAANAGSATELGASDIATMRSLVDRSNQTPLCNRCLLRYLRRVMPELDKKSLSERDICTKFITPALTAGNKWDVMSQIREEVYFTKGRLIVRGQLSTRGEAKRADYFSDRDKSL